jgi:hypothetical protein
MSQGGRETNGARVRSGAAVAPAVHATAVAGNGVVEADIAALDGGVGKTGASTGVALRAVNQWACTSKTPYLARRFG